MSGADVPDDAADIPDDAADDVTLWAGRLRAWPVAPTLDEVDEVDEVDDETVRSARSVPGTGHRAPEGVTDPVDDTVRVRSAVRRSAPPSSVDPQPESEQSHPDEDTAVSRSSDRRAERAAEPAAWTGTGTGSVAEPDTAAPPRSPS